MVRLLSLAVLIVVFGPASASAAAPESDEAWKLLKNPVLTVAVEEICPTTTARVYEIVATLLSRQGIALETTRQRTNVELNCYYPKNSGKLHYMLISRFFSAPGSTPSSYRRIGALPDLEETQASFLDRQLERTIQDMLLHHLSQNGLN